MRTDARTSLHMMLLALGLALLSSAAQAQTAPEHNLPPPCRAEQDFAHKAEALIAERISAARARLRPGAPVLRPDEQLSRIAELRSCELAWRHTPLSHLDDKGHFESADIVYSVLGPYGRVGENLMQMEASASQGAKPLEAEEFAQAAADLWLKSAEHRSHILDPRYDLSGIGVAMVGGEAVATEIFHGPPNRRGRAAARPAR